MLINLYTVVLNAKLLHNGFNSSLGLNLNFEIESLHKLVMNLNVDFQKSMNWNVDFLKSINLNLRFFKIFD